MRHHHLFILSLLTLLLFSTALGSASGQDTQTYWYNGHTRTELYFSDTEIAVFPSAPKHFAKALRNREIFAHADVDKSGDFATYLRVSSEHSPFRSSVHGQAVDHPSIRELAPVYYPSKVARPMSRMVPTDRFAVQFRDQSEAEILRIEKELGLDRILTFPFAAPTFLYAADDPMQAIRLANTIYETHDVAFATPDWLREHQHKAVPNDPFYSEQWHLTNTGQTGGPAGLDIAGGAMETVWETVKGSSQEVIAIVDDGVEIVHQDLAPNVRADLGYDFISNDADPSPSSADPHGTASAGLAAGRGFNAQGVTGAAPLASLVGMRLLGAETDANSALAETMNNQVIDIYSNSWGPFDDGDRLAGPGPLLTAALYDAVMNGRQGLGNVYVWASGNGLQFEDNANYDGFANSPYILAVAASNHLGEQAFYSEPGACIAINVPSSGGGVGVSTTDLTGSLGYNIDGESDFTDTDYTMTFGGTSASAPVAAGAVALLLEANPDLTWREVQAILKHTAVKNDPTDSDWTINGAGYHVNHKYGFGRLDMLAALEAAITWSSSGQAVEAQASAAPWLPIPDDDAAGISSTVSIADKFSVEYVEVYFSSTDHPYWGDLKVELVSPDGTVSVLAEPHFVSPGSAVFDNWRFGSARHFGESSAGDWTLRVSDNFSQDSGTFQNWMLVLHGWQGISGPVDRLFFPHVTVANGWTTEIGILNNSGENALNATLRSYDALGNQIAPPFPVNLPPNGRLEFDVATTLQDPAAIAYCVLNAPPQQARGYLQFAIPGMYRAAVPAAASTQGFRLNMPHIASDFFWWTGLALMNTTLMTRELTFNFNNGDTKTVVLGPLEKKALLLRKLFNGQPQPDITSAVITGAQGVVGLQLFGGGDMLAGGALHRKVDATLTYPHIIDTPGWWTGLVAHNPGLDPVNAKLASYTESGVSLTPAQLSIEPGSSVAGFSGSLGLGTDTAWAQTKPSAPLDGLELFGTLDNKAMAGLNVTGLAATSGRLPKINPLGWTNIGATNVVSTEAMVTFTALDDDGNTVAQFDIQLAGREKKYQPASSLFGLQPLAGATHIMFSSDKPLVVFQVTGSPDGTMLDAMPAM